MLFRNEKLQYFKDKLKSVQKMTWDLEFKLFKTKELREEVRKQYDRVKETVDALNIEIQKRVDQKDKQETLLALEEKKKPAVNDLKNLTEQLGAFDQEIEGTQLNPDGTPSIQSQLDGLYELKLMLNDYIKKNL